MQRRRSTVSTAPDRRTATLNDWGICPGRGIPGTGQWTRGRRPARRDGADTAGGLNSGRSVRAPCVGQPHPVVDGGRPDCPRSAGRQRRTGPSAPRFGGAKDQRRTAPPRSCSAGAAVPGWAGRSRCPGTPAAVGAAGEAGTAPGHDPAAPGYGSPTRRHAAARLCPTSVQSMECGQLFMVQRRTRRVKPPPRLS